MLTRNLTGDRECRVASWEWDGQDLDRQRSRAYRCWRQFQGLCSRCDQSQSCPYCFLTRLSMLIVIPGQTFALEQTKLSQTQQRLWYLVQSAQQAALDAAVKQRSTGHSVDAAARDLIDKRGIWPEEKRGLTHRLGMCQRSRKYVHRSLG